MHQFLCIHLKLKFECKCIAIEGEHLRRTKNVASTFDEEEVRWNASLSGRHLKEYKLCIVENVFDKKHDVNACDECKKKNNKNGKKLWKNSCIIKFYLRNKST